MPKANFEHLNLCDSFSREATSSEATRFLFNRAAIRLSR